MKKDKGWVKIGFFFFIFGALLGLVLLKAGFPQNNGLFTEKEITQGYVDKEVLAKLLFHSEEGMVIGLVNETQSLPPNLEKDLRENHGLQSWEYLGRGWFHLVFGGEKSTQELLGELSDKFDVLEPNFICQAQKTKVQEISLGKVTPNDPEFTWQWYLEKIKAPQAWQITTGSSEVKIALLDTGVEFTHPDLKANLNLNLSKNLLNEKLPPTDDNGHGTAIAGIIGAVGNNGLGITGLNWKVNLLVYKVLNSQGYGSIDKIIKGINLAKANGAKIVNLSFGGENDSQALRETIQEAHYLAGIIFVAPGGNKGVLLHPADYPEVLGVGGVDSKDRRWVYMNEEEFASAYGEELDVSGPAEDIYTTLKGGNYGYVAGTSASAGIVSAVIGLVLAVDNSLTAEEIYELVRKSVDPAVSEPDKPIPGRINAQKAVEQVGGRRISVECGECIKDGDQCCKDNILYKCKCYTDNEGRLKCDWLPADACQSTPPQTPECTPGQKMTQLCWTTDGKPGQQERTCGSDGKWGPWGECKEVGASPPSQPDKKENGRRCNKDEECQSGHCWDHDNDGTKTCQSAPPPGASPSPSPSPGQCGGGGSPSPGTSPSPGSQGLPKGSPCFSDGMCASGSCNCTKMPNTNICQGIGTCN